jgi:Tfp pilus assembly protein PilF
MNRERLMSEPPILEPPILEPPRSDPSPFGPLTLRLVSGRALRRGVLVGLLALAGAVAPAGPARAEGKDFSMSQWVAAQLSEARDEIGEKKYKEALETLNSARDRGKLSPHEKAMVAQTEGYVHSAKSDYKRAAERFEAALAEDAMPDPAVLELHYNLGQLYQIQQQYKQAIIHLLRWVSKVKNPKGRDLFMLATTYYQAERKDGALKWARRAIATTKTPNEEWLNLVSSILFEQQAYSQLPAVLEPLAALYPKKLYYDQLFVVMVKNKREQEGLAVLEMSYLQGFLTKDEELRNLAMMYVGRGVPLKGAELLEKGIKAGSIPRDYKTNELLAECYLAAKELDKALDPLGRAAKVASKGDLYMRIAEIHVNARRWGEAREALNQAIAKGKLGDPGSAYLLLGIANFRDKKLGQASVAFNKALKHARAKKQAEQWLTLLESKKADT